MRILCLALAFLPPWCGQALTLVHYNVHGNGASDWSTNSSQVQAIGRVVSFLNPDVITFNEIPNSKTWEMTNFVNAYLPGYWLATNSGTDGFIRSVIASRHPIVRSQSWLTRSNLLEFGFDGVYTRDLFEAEIQVPDASEPLHVFTTHLKCCSDTTSKQRRGAEARAVSNFLATIFLPTNGGHAYVLTGDLNEDIERPYPNSGFAIETLISEPTGLLLTRPVNTITGDDRTWSMQSLPLSIRFDYVLPCGLLYSNPVGSELFRSDLATNLVPPLLAGDSATASDHLPVVMTWNYPDPALLLQAVASNGLVQVSWPALVGREFSLQTSTNLVDWADAVTNVVAATTNVVLDLSADADREYLRVVRIQ